jgi:ADP-ribosylglycohydrolase
LDAGPGGEFDNGNGALMRSLPLVLWHEGPDDELAEWAHLQSRVTHGHLKSQVCCALYCLWARRVLKGSDHAWEEGVRSLRRIYRDNAPALEELEGSIRPDEPPQGNGSGYVADCLRSAHWATQQGDYERTVRSAISLGNDTDTTACVAGGIAGLREGAKGIPLRWRQGLQGEGLARPLLNRLLQRERKADSAPPGKRSG